MSDEHLSRRQSNQSYASLHQKVGNNRGVQQPANNHSASSSYHLLPRRSSNGRVEYNDQSNSGVASPPSTAEDEALSPASSIGSSASAMSLSSVDASPVPSPMGSEFGGDSSASERMSVCSSVSSCSSTKRRRRTSSSEEQPPTRRPRTDNMEHLNLPVRALPVATHRPSHDPRLQSEFMSAVEASNVPLVTQLLRAHAYTARVNVNVFDAEGQTPLHLACATGQLDMAKVLVEHGADAQMRSREGWSVLHIASFCGNPEMLMFVLKATRRS